MKKSKKISFPKKKVLKKKKTYIVTHWHASLNYNYNYKTDKQLVNTY